MLAASDAFTLDVEGVEMLASFRVEIDLPGGIYPDVTLSVSSLQLQESINEPLNTARPTGYPSASVDLTLAGMLDEDDETLTPAWLFSPYRTDSPLYRTKVRGCPVRVFLGLVPAESGTAEVFRKFTGTIDTYAYDTAAGTVQLSCIDRRNELRSSVDVPSVVTAPPFNAGLTSEFAVDALLRSATDGAVSSWPATRADCVLAVGMRALLWPEVGALDTSGAQPSPTFPPGAFGSALGTVIPGVEVGALDKVTYQLAGTVGLNMFAEFWVNDLDSAGVVNVYVGTPNLTEYLQIHCDGSAATVETLDGAFTFPADLSTGRHYIAAAATLPAGLGTVTGTLYVDSATSSFSMTLPRAVPEWGAAFVVSAGAVGTVEAVQISTEATPVDNHGFTPQAVLEPSLNTLQVIPAITGDPWQAIQQIADAEQAVAGWDQSANVFRFTNRDTIRTGAVARTVTSETSLLALQIGVDGAGFADDVQVPYTPWTFGARATVWSLTDVKKVPRASSITIVATLDTAAAALDVTPIWLPDTPVAPGGSYYRSSSDQFGTASGPRIIITVVQTDAASLTLTATNPANYDAWLISSAAHTDLPVGTPCLIIGGQPVTPGTEQAVEKKYGAGTTAYVADSNPWIQDEDTAARLALDTLSSLAFDRPNLTSVGIVPDPRLQLVDRLLIQDPDVSAINEYAVLFGQTIGLTANGNGTTYSHTIDARAVTFPGGWILGVAGRTELAETTLI